MQDSSNLINCQNDLTASGQWLQLKHQERKTISKLILRRAAIERDLDTVHQMLRGCNDPVRLAEFEKGCGGRRDFRYELPQLAKSLEAKKSDLLASICDIDQQLDRLGCKLAFGNLGTTSLIRRTKKSNPLVAKRNEIIDDNVGLSAIEICRRLDQELSTNGRVPYDYLPPRWRRLYGANSFSAAYKVRRCRRLMDKMFSVRRRQSRGYS